MSMEAVCLPTSSGSIGSLLPEVSAAAGPWEEPRLSEEDPSAACVTPEVLSETKVTPKPGDLERGRDGDGSFCHIDLCSSLALVVSTRR